MLRTLRLTAVKEPPKGLIEDDCFHLTREANDKHGCTLAVRSLLSYLGFQPDGAQELNIAAMGPERHSLSVILPGEQKMAADSGEDSNAEAEEVDVFPRSVLSFPHMWELPFRYKRAPADPIVMEVITRVP